MFSGNFFSKGNFDHLIIYFAKEKCSSLCHPEYSVNLLDLRAIAS